MPRSRPARTGRGRPRTPRPWPRPSPHADCGLPATTAESATAGTRVTRATSQPPSQRPVTIVRTGAGDSQVKWNVPARTSAPSTASPMTRQAKGTTSRRGRARRPGRRRAPVGRRRPGPAGRRAPLPRREAPGATTAAAAGRRATCSRATARRRRHRTSSRKRLSSESSSGRTSSSRASTDRGQTGQGDRQHRGRGSTTRQVVAVDADAADRRRAPAARPRVRRVAAVRTSTRRGRSAMASRMARWPPAAASRPRTRTIWRSASRSTSCSTCELTITVRPSSPSRWNRSIRCGALHRVGAVQRLVEHEDDGLRDERGSDLRPLAHALAEPADPAVGDVEQPDGRQRASARGADRARRGGRAT